MIKNGIISTELLKPALQIPHRQKYLKLSYLDRLLPPVYVPLIFFYGPHESAASTHLQRLKQSLLQTLPSFYPLAGRLRYNDAIDCNDGGVEFVDARVHAHLNDVVHKSDVEHLKQYIPQACSTFDHGQLPLVVVQTTLFDCGGLALSLCISHKIGDLASAISFLNAWAAKCRGQHQISDISFGTSSYFPALSFFPYSIFIKLFESNHEFVTKRFVFESEKLECLKRAATSSHKSAVKDPSRVELVSAFIWKHFMGSRLRNANSIFAAIMAVSLRARTSPPGLLEDVFGNCFMSPFEFDDSSGNFEELIGKIRRLIGRVEGDYITKILHKESYIKDLGKMAVLLLLGKVEWCYFTSWRGFPVHEVDYGWGNPVWFTTSSMPIKNLVVLVDSRSGDDIEVIITMKPEDLQIIEKEISLISTPTVIYSN